MGGLRFKDRLLSGRSRGAFGIPRSVRGGQAALADLPHVSERAGIYQTVRTKNGLMGRRLKWYRPSNPRTEAQMAWRAVFKGGFDHWHTLDDEQKSVYNKRAKILRMSGFNLHQREWLNAHKHN